MQTDPITIDLPLIDLPEERNFTHVKYYRFILHENFVIWQGRYMSDKNFDDVGWQERAYDFKTKCHKSAFSSIGFTLMDNDEGDIYKLTVNFLIESVYVYIQGRDELLKIYKILDQYFFP